MKVKKKKRQSYNHLSDLRRKEKEGATSGNSIAD